MSHRVYFASDLHLGVPDIESSRVRERKFINWLEDVSLGQGIASSGPATEIHLLGDLFDFWFEYKNVVPKGGVRMMGAIAKITDLGIPVHYHLGNHDLWSFGYLESELGVQIHTSPVVREWDGLKCLIGHGDGLGPGDRGYKLTKKVYRSKLAQFMFRWLHPDIGIRMAHRLSKNSRSAGGRSGGPYTSPEKENLHQYCQGILKSDPSMNAFIFGHRHLPLDLTIPNDSEKSVPARYINIGDWITHFSYAKIEKGILTLNT